MAIQFHCATCNKELTAPDTAAGTRLMCPRCGMASEVPGSHEGLPIGARSIAVKMRFACPKCAGLLEIDVREAGSQMLCSRCHASIKAPDSILGPGAFVAGFQIVRPLDGDECTGNAFLARRPGDTATVVLKVLRLDLSLPKEVRDRYQKAMQTAAQLKHSNIVTVLDVGEDGNALYAVTEHIEGDSLPQLLKSGQPMPEDQALAITKQMATGLAYAWDKQRLAHLDIRPEKLILDRQGRLKIIGLCWPKLDKTTRGSIVGNTTNFLSPEVLDGTVAGSKLNELSGRPVPDCRSDMYSVGLVLYYLLTGRVPFHGQSLLDTLRNQVESTLDNPRDMQPAISDSCLALLEKMLARKLMRRYPCWEELLGDLERARQGTLDYAPIMPAGESAIRRAPPAAVPASAAQTRRRSGSANATAKGGITATKQRAAYGTSTINASLGHGGMVLPRERAQGAMTKLVLFTVACVVFALILLVVVLSKRSHDREIYRRERAAQEAREKQAYETPSKPASATRKTPASPTPAAKTSSTAAPASP